MAPGMPSWHDIGTTRIPTKAYVPRGAKKIWGQCVAAALGQILLHGDDKAWREWYMLAKAVLRSADRGGKKNGKMRAELETRDRARAWLEGKRGKLWEAPRVRKKDTQGPEGGARDEESQQRARALELAKEGLLSKACSALISEPPVEVDD
jgi:hypothetical protein